MQYRKILFALLAAAFSNGAFAGSIITTNLPSGSAIVNIDGRNDGAASYDGDQSNWFRPFAVDGNLLELTLDPGTYRFNVVDPTDAHALFPSLTSAQLGTIGSSWTYNSPFTTSYFVFDASAANDPSQRQIFAGANQGPDANGNYYFYNGEDAYHATKAAGFADQIYTGPGGRNRGDVAYSYTLTQRETLIFVVPDYALGDNGGVVSVAVTPVPEPMTLLGLGGALLVGARRRRSAR